MRNTGHEEDAQTCTDKLTLTISPAQILQALSATLNATVTDVDVAVTELQAAFDGLSMASETNARETAATHKARAITAFQFHDALDQRVGHVRDALQQMAQVLTQHEELAQTNSPMWTKLADSLRDSCPLEKDKRFFAAPCNGKQKAEPRQLKSPAGEVELF